MSQPILPFLSCWMVKLTKEYGFCDDSIVGFATCTLTTPQRQHYSANRDIDISQTTFDFDGLSRAPLSSCGRQLMQVEV